MNHSAAHSALKRDILLQLGSDTRWRLFGNQVGHAFDPKSGAHFPFGLVVGASDILAIVRPRGRWAVLEVKTGEARATKEQRAFLRTIAAFGGLARVVRSVEEAKAALCEAYSSGGA